MILKKTICIFISAVLMLTSVNIFAASDIDSYISKTINETDSDAQSLLGDDVVFMTSNGKFYANGEKLSCTDYGMNSYYDNGNIMVDARVFCAALNMPCELSGSTLIINDKSFNAVKKDDAFFVNANEAGKALFKYVYENDNRQFLLLSNTIRNYTNAISSRDNQEKIDLIWRYMQFDRPGGDELYSALVNNKQEKVHPRLLIKKSEIDAFKARVDNDEYMKSVKEELITTCDSYINTDVVKYELEGFRLFSACGKARKRLINLCTAYLLTNNIAYAQRAWVELENVCNWNDWNVKSHFLDSGRLASGVAFAYDVLYDYIGSLDGDKRAWVRERITSLYLDYCVGVYTGDSAYKATSSKHTSTNWGAVTSASMLMTSLTFIDEEAETSALTKKCKYIAENTLQTFEHILTAVAPDGAWAEGMGYYEYVMQHVGWSMLSLKNLTGNDYSFLSSNGLSDLPEYAMFMMTKNGSFNKGSTTGNAKKFAPEAMIYATLYNNNSKMKQYNSFYKEMQMSTFPAEYLLFCNPEMSGNSTDAGLSLDRYYQTNGNTIIKGSWENLNSLYLAVSGGNGGHYDKGSFVFEALGERWSIDMGRNDVATMPYLKRTETHSALVINPSEDDAGQVSDAPFVSVDRFETKSKGALAIYDLTDVYSDGVSGYKRGFLVSDDRNTLTIRDEVSLSSKSELCWNMITKANITLSDDKKSATLVQNGKKLIVTAYCSADDWEFSVAEDLAPTGGWKEASVVDGSTTVIFTAEEQKSFSKGTKKLMIKTGADNNAVIEVKLTPQIDGEFFTPLENIPLSDWSIPEGENIKIDGIKCFDTFVSGYDIPFSAVVEDEFKSLGLYVNDELLSSFTHPRNDKRYSFIIPKNKLNCGGDLKITLLADYGEYQDEKSIIINIIKEYKRNLIKGIDFSAYPDGESTVNEIKEALGLNSLELKNGYGQISKVRGLTEDCLKMQLTPPGDAPYLQIANEPEAIGDIIYLSFDVMTNKKDNLLYMSAFGGGTQYIFRNDGTFLDGIVEYKINTPYHVETIINTLNGTYQVYITDESGMLIAKTDFKAIETFKNGYRLSFRAASGEDGYFMIDNMNISTSEYMIIEDIKSGYDLDLSCGDKVVAIKVTNKTSWEKNPVLVIAGYGEDNELLLPPAYVCENIQPGEAKTLTATLKNDADLECIKVFLWDDQNMSPIKYAQQIR